MEKTKDENQIAMSSLFFRVTIFSIAILMFAQLSMAQLSPQYSDCMIDAGGVTYDMTQCMNEEIAYQNERLDKALQGVMKQLILERQNKLAAAQKLWKQYRELSCRFYYDPDGGTMVTLNVSSCFMTKTATKADEIESMLEF